MGDLAHRLGNAALKIFAGFAPHKTCYNMPGLFFRVLNQVYCRPSFAISTIRRSRTHAEARCLDGPDCAESDAATGSASCVCRLLYHWLIDPGRITDAKRR